ncbi:MAG: DUF4974 domain-containing protein [Sphingobacterium sp.]|jgi:ferric-dicitrate binding protein FerR (iron transport regulator)|nr:DUF4974 domain-containing protein [Sphingobacterium sp.]
MIKEDIKAILDKIGTTELTVEEQAKVDLWLFQLHQRDESALSEEAIKSASSQIWTRLDISEVSLAPKRPVRLWHRWAMVAALFVAIVATSVFILYRQGDTPTALADIDQISPGKDGATLTLADGRTIAINDLTVGDIAEQSGVLITKGADGQLIYEIKDTDAGKASYNTLTTSRGEQTKVRLPDGSLVYLNASSSLTYPTSFALTVQRIVKLAGEGYFQVAKDKEHPFVVRTENQEVVVLGTHFNVNTYDADHVITTLEEGAVKVNNGTVGKTIRPGEQTINASGKLKVQEADMEQVFAWKNGDFVFTGDDIQTVMKQLERWYDIEVIYEGPAINGLFYANISRQKEIAEVLKLLEKTNGVHFKIKGRRVVVSR